jgi:hypothetical protein
VEDITEHLINYTYKGSERTMLVKRVGLGVASSEFYIIRSAKGTRNIQKYNGKWHVVSPLQMNDELLQIIGASIERNF